MSIFSSSLEILLQERKMSQAKLAEESGLTPSAICQFISEEREPTCRTLIKICSALSITPNDILGFHSGTNKDLSKENSYLKHKIKTAMKVLGE